MQRQPDDPYGEDGEPGGTRRGRMVAWVIIAAYAVASAVAMLLRLVR